MSQHCECNHISVVPEGTRGWYDPDLEWPFVNHQPGQRKCTHLLRQFKRDGKVIWLCNCCWLTSDKPV